MERIRNLCIANVGDELYWDEETGKAFVSFICSRFIEENIPPTPCHYQFNEIPLFSMVKCPWCGAFIKVG